MYVSQTNATEMEHQVKSQESGIENSGFELSAIESRDPEEKWLIRLLIAMAICLIAVCVMHAVGEAMIIARICT